MYKYKSLLIFIALFLALFSCGFIVSSFNPHSQVLEANDQSWNLEMINLNNTWDITQGNPGVTVAIIGWGVNTTHPELKDNIIASWDFIDNREKVYDPNGHDTCVAGIVLSIAPQVTLITARVLDSEGTDVGKLDEAIEFVTKKGADIILMPITILNPEPSNRYNDNVQSSVIDAYSRQVRFIISAQGRGRHHSHRFPGRLAGVYNVAGVNQQGTYSLSSTANELNFISAPCEDIPCLETKGDWTNVPGTSWSSAHLAGVVALMLSANPFLNNVEIEDILIDTVQDRGVFGKDIYYGWGLVDCWEAVNRANKLLLADIVSDSLQYQWHPYHNDLNHILSH